MLDQAILFIDKHNLKRKKYNDDLKVLCFLAHTGILPKVLR